MSARRNHILIFATISAITPGMLGCMSRTATDERPFQEAAAFSMDGDAAIEQDWWVAFEDPSLNIAIERALNDNFSLEAARQRLLEARALARRQSATLWPSLDFLGGGERSERSGDGTSGDESFVELGVSAAYEVDLWGRLGALAEAEDLRAEAAEALLQTSALTLSAEVAVTWYRLAGAQAQKKVLAEQLETNRTVLELLEARFQRGQIRAADVLRQRQLIEATIEQLNDVAVRAVLLNQLLATLQGVAPQNAGQDVQAELVTLPTKPEPGLPAELLQRRPDVRQAFMQIEAADAELAAAISARYPRINLSLSALTNDRGSGSIFESWVTRLAGEFALPLIDGGSRRADVSRREALLGERLAIYGETVLTAFREVENALAREYHQGIKVEQVETQLRLADETSNQLRNQYLNGVSDYIEVLDALREQQVLARELVAARQGLIEIRISLHRALAGGFLTTP